MKKKYTILLILTILINSFSSAQTFVKDFFSIEEFVTVNDQSFFVANDGIHGLEIWKTDGTLENTILVKDIYRGSDSSDPKRLTPFNNAVYFTANEGINGFELWKSDGTEEGTILVKNIHKSHKQGSNPLHFTVYNNELYFTATDYFINGSYQLWKTDGTEEGTIKVHDAGGGTVFNLRAANNKLYFTIGNELYETDGTPGNIKQIPIDEYYNISELNSFNNELYFITHSSYRQAIRLYRLDAAGNVLLLQEFIQPQYGNQDIFNFTQIGDEIYFSVTTDFNSGTDTDVLWKTDGTLSGTQPVKSFAWDRHLSGSNISNFIEYKNELYFNSGSQNNFTLWKSDGSVTGTTQVSNTRIDRSVDFIILNELLYFSSGLNLWSTDGTDTNTKKFSNVTIAYKNSDDHFNVKGTTKTIFFEANYQTNRALYTTALSPIINVKNGYSSLEINEIISFESKIDSAAYKTITVNNIGNKELVFSKIEVIGQDYYINGKRPNNSTPLNPEGNFHQILKPGERSEFQITFYPSSAGLKKASINILSNDVAIPNFTIKLLSNTFDEAGQSPSESINLDKEIVFNTTDVQITIDTNTILENAAINSLVGIVSVPNNNSDLIYELTSGEGDSDNHFFTILNNELKTNTVFDFELKNTLTIRVKATDSANNQVIEGNLIIQVLNENEDPILEPCGTEFVNMVFGFFDVEFLDNENVIAIGTHGIIIKSNDGGQTWKKVSHATFNHLWDLQFISDTIGFAIGDSQMLKTEDAGESWFNIPIPDTSYPFPRNLLFINSEVGFVFGSDGKIFKTTDSGKFWRQKYSGHTDYLSGFFLNGSKGFITGSSETLIKTVDGGETWENVDLGIPGLRYNIKLTTIYFVNDQIGFITGDYGEIIKTIDGGNTWVLFSELEYNINTKDMLFLDENVGYIVTSGYIYKTIDGGITWANDENFPSFYPESIGISANGEHTCVVGTGGSGWVSDTGSSITYKHLSDPWVNVSFFRGNTDIYSTHFSGDEGYVFGAYESGKTIDGGITWKAITPPETEIFQVEVLNNNMFALGRNYVYKSTDSGATWIILSASNYFVELFFLNEQTIFAIASERGIFKSTDGGLTWVNVSTELFGETGLYFKNELEGYAVGIGGMIKTEDGGNNWVPVDLELEAGYSFLYSIKFFNDSVGIAGSNDGIIYRTEDGGLTWAKIYTVMNRNVKFIHAISELEWYAMGVYGGTSILYKSIDGGINWLRQHIADGNIYDVHFDNEIMYCVGQGGPFYKMTSSSAPALPGFIEGNMYVSTQTTEDYTVVKNPNSLYSWSVSGDNQITYKDNKATISWNTPGTYLVTVTPINRCATGPSREITVQVEEGPDPFITGNSEVNEFSAGNEYFTTLRTGSRYHWSVIGHQNFSAAMNTVSIDWGERGFGEIEVIETKNLSGARKSALLSVSINTVLGIDDIQADKNILVYPNPVEGQMYITLANDIFFNMAKVQLFDFTGRIYRSEVLHLENNNKIELNLGNIPSGIYIVKVSIDNKKYVKKIIKI